MNGYGRPIEYDYFLVRHKVHGIDRVPVESKNHKNWLLLFTTDFGAAEEWVPKKVVKLKEKDTGELVARIESWWVKTRPSVEAIEKLKVPA